MELSLHLEYDRETHKYILKETNGPLDLFNASGPQTKGWDRGPHLRILTICVYIYIYMCVCVHISYLHYGIRKIQLLSIISFPSNLIYVG